MVKRGLEDFRTYEEINKKIKLGDAVVLTADEFIKRVENKGIKISIMGEYLFRMVTYLNISRSDVDTVVATISDVFQ